MITASEIGHYAYCRRAWWLVRVRGYEPENLQALQRGIERHEAHGTRVMVAEERLRLARVLVMGALVCSVVLVLLMVYR